MSALIPEGSRPKAKSEAKSKQTRSTDSKGHSQDFKKIVTFGVAAIVDALQVAMLASPVPFLAPALSVVAAAIFFRLWGWRIEILGAFIPEVIPGVSTVPAWVVIAFLLTKNDPASERLGKFNSNVESSRD